MKLLPWLVVGALIAAVPICLFTYVWTSDLRWLASGVISGGFLGLVYVMGKAPQ